MILWSNQVKIVNDFSLSFQKNEKIHTKIQESVLQRDKSFLSPSKYDQYTKSDFKFIVLWTCLNYGANKIDTLKILNNYSKDDINIINHHKNKLINYKSTIKNDKIFMNQYQNTLSSVMNAYYKGNINIASTWLNIKDKKPETRVQKKFINNINFFMSYFDKIKTNIEEIEGV